MKKPIEPQIPLPGPPSHLSKRAKDLWKEIVPGRARSPGRVALLQTALEALDRADECRRLIKEKGLTTVTKSTGATHLNPVVKLERESRQLFIRAWAQLHLHWDSKIDGDTRV